MSPRLESNSRFRKGKYERSWLTPTVIALRKLFDNNVPIGRRRLLPGHEIRTILEMNGSPRIINCELLRSAEAAGFEILLTCDQSIRYRQNLVRRKLALVIHDPNLWASVPNRGNAIAAAVGNTKPGSCQVISVLVPPKPRKSTKS